MYFVLRSVYVLHLCAVMMYCSVHCLLCVPERVSGLYSVYLFYVHCFTVLFSVHTLFSVPNTACYVSTATF